MAYLSTASSIIHPYLQHNPTKQTFVVMISLIIVPAVALVVAPAAPTAIALLAALAVTLVVAVMKRHLEKTYIPMSAVIGPIPSPFGKTTHYFQSILKVG